MLKTDECPPRGRGALRFSARHLASLAIASSALATLLQACGGGSINVNGGVAAAKSDLVPPELGSACVITTSAINSLVTKGTGLAFDGISFGSVGTYTYILAEASASVSASDACATSIVDLKNAADTSGKISYSFDVVILTPTAAAKANGTLLYEAVASGSSRAFGVLNEGTANDLFNARAPNIPADINNVISGEGAGNGFLLNRGTTMVWSGWQGDLPQSLVGGARISASTPWFAPGMSLPASVNVSAGRALITGNVQDEFIASDGTTAFGTWHAMATGTLANATLTIQKSPGATPVKVSNTYWTYTAGSGVAEAGSSSAAGFGYVTINRSALVASGLYASALDSSVSPTSDKGAIYRFNYTAVNPKPAGLGFLAVRDLITYLRDAAQDSAGNPNPLAGRVQKTLATGVGVPARFLRDFVWQGFNTNARRAAVFDGMLLVSAGAGKSYTNYRWAKPGLDSHQHESHDTPGDQFPFAWSTLTDPVSGRSDGLFKKCDPLSHCPKVFQADSPAQFFQSRASLTVTDGAGKDVSPPANVRMFYVPGASSLPQTLADTIMTQPDMATNRSMATNEVSAMPDTLQASSALMRALFDNLDAWVKGSASVLAGNYPKVSDGTLAVPGSLPGSIGAPDLVALGLDFKGAYNALRLNDESVIPSLSGSKSYVVHLPATDAQGNDRAGVKLPDSAVPLATFRGYSLRRPGFMDGQLNGLAGSQIAFALNNAQRKSGDSRSSIASLYGSKAGYLSRYNSAVDQLQASGILLADDALMYKNRALIQMAQPYFSTLP